MSRQIDELGYIEIPIELRRTLGLNEKDSLEVILASSQIILRKYEPSCVFCGSPDEVANYKGKHLCKACLLELKHLV